MTGSSTWALPEAGTSACPAPVRSGEHENLRREIWVTRACAALTLCALGAFVALDIPSLERGGVPAAIYLVLVSALVYGGLVYQVSRLAWLRRMRAGEAAMSQPAEWDREAEDAARQASVVVLVPSYKEEAAIVRQTLLSAALQDHPNRRVVLLIDDPPNPTDPDDRASLDAMRASRSSSTRSLRSRRRGSGPRSRRSRRGACGARPTSPPKRRPSRASTRPPPNG
jgi:hypothetical protein